MKTLPSFLFALVISLLPLITDAQTNRIENTRLELQGDLLLITYDIVGTTALEEVWIEVTTENDLLIEARSLSGDIGNNIQPGNNKRIIWDMAADGVDLEGKEVSVRVIAKQDNEDRISITEVYPAKKQSPVRDRIYLRNGSDIKGLILTNRTATDVIRIQEKGGSVRTIDVSEITKIEPTVSTKETLYLKNGDVLIGKLEAIYPNDFLRFKTNESNLKIPLTDIDRIISEGSGASNSVRLHASLPYAPFGVKYMKYDNWGWYGFFSTDLFIDWDSFHIGLGTTKAFSPKVHGYLGTSLLSYNLYSFVSSSSVRFNEVAIDLGVAFMLNKMGFDIGFGLNISDPAYSYANLGIGFNF